MIQVLVAMISYVLLRLVQKGSQSALSLQTITRRLITSLMQRRDLKAIVKGEDEPPLKATNDDQFLLALS